MRTTLPHSLQHTLGLIVRWFDPAQAETMYEQLRIWDAATWQMAQQVIVMQGIGPYLHAYLPSSLLWPTIPAAMRAWLAWQHAMNADRMTNFQSDLQPILQRANRVGIRVMPLKGALLAWRYYADPALRPMADLDLLIEPAALSAMTALLTELGYYHSADQARVTDHHRFTHLVANKVVARDCEHPDNPRRLELHTGLRRNIWNGARHRDLTMLLWSAAQESRLLGEPIWQPSADALLTTVVAHAAGHFFRREGRILQWLDIAQLTPTTHALPIDEAVWTYPIYRLAQRALPGALAQVNLQPLAAQIPLRLQQWSDQVSLDQRCGLVVARQAPDVRYHQVVGRLGLLWDHWQPSPWRLALVYGNLPLPLAYGRYAQSVLATVWERIRP